MPMSVLQPRLTSAWKKDVKSVEARGWDIDNVLLPPLEILLNKQQLPPQYRDHPLKGE